MILSASKLRQVVKEKGDERCFPANRAGGWHIPAPRRGLTTLLEELLQ